MTNATIEQPKPIATNKRPIWPVVIAYVERNYENAEGDTTITKLVADMSERHQGGIARYGVPLTSGNGRDSMIDAYQELLDFVVYTRTWLDEHNVEVLSPGVMIKAQDGIKISDDGKTAEIVDQQAFIDASILTPVEALMANLFTHALDALCSLRGAMP